MTKRNVFVIGDSISVHYGAYLERMLTGRFECGRRAGAPGPDSDEGLGGNGGDTRKVIEFLEAEKDRGVDYDILVINSGLHDIKVFQNRPTCSVELNEYEDNLQRIVERANAMSNHLFWVRTTAVEDERHNSRSDQFKRYDRDVTRYNRAADSVMAERNVPVIDLNDFTRSLGQDIYCDHVHYTDRVRELQAAFIAGHLFAAT